MDDRHSTRASRKSLNVPAEPRSHLDADEIAGIARRYAAQGLFDEAIHLYEMACKLRPGSVSLRINLTRTRDLKSEAENARSAAIREQILAEHARDETDAAQAIGLAQFYLAKDQTAKAIELLEIAKLKTPNSFRPRELLSRLYFSQGEWEIAAEEVRSARAINPFDRATAELSGRIQFELKFFDKALDDFIDAFLLSPDQKSDAAEPVRRMIATLRRFLNLDAKSLNASIRKRVEQLQDATERLELRKENLFRFDSRQSMKQIMQKVTRDAEKRDSLISMSANLRMLPLFEHMHDDHLFRLARFVRPVTTAAGEYLFRQNERSMDFYIVSSGSIQVRVETPFGAQLLADLGPGKIVGEMNFIDRTHRSTDALATADTTCYGFSFSALDQMMAQEKEIAVGLHWAFWGSLTEKVRDANEQLKMFFVENGHRAPGRRTIESKREMTAVTVKSAEKVDLFLERGLSGAEMKLLATFSTEEKFRPGSIIFREGDKGDKLYIVLSGQVRISKFIPGVGEEALAVLDRGAFFGEMALVDEKPRSADAKAHESDATVLSIDRSTLHEILSMDPHASLQFLSLLCRMISRRLREINDKIVQWKYMAGAF